METLTEKLEELEKSQFPPKKTLEFIYGLLKAYGLGTPSGPPGGGGDDC